MTDQSSRSARRSTTPESSCDTCEVISFLPVPEIRLTVSPDKTGNSKQISQEDNQPLVASTPVQPSSESQTQSSGPDSSTPTEFRATVFARKSDLARWLPQLETERRGFSALTAKRSRMLLLQIGLIALVLIVNITVTIYGSRHYGNDGQQPGSKSKSWIGTIYAGDCTRVQNLNRWFHLLINVLSTAMLGASNFCMQLQAAPTGGDVDAAHARDEWLDIGIPSIRNVTSRRVAGWRRAGWLILALSSLPIHLTYNSAAFQSLSSNDYTVGVVTESFVTDRSIPWSTAAADINAGANRGWMDKIRANPLNINSTSALQRMQSAALVPGALDRLDVSTCFQRYNDYWTPQADVLLVVSNDSLRNIPTGGQNSSLLLYTTVNPPVDDWAKNMWAVQNGSSEFFALTILKSSYDDVTDWTVGNEKFKVEYCLAQAPSANQPRCRFHYSPCLLAIVSALNGLKMVVMVVIWWAWTYKKLGERGETEVLYTLGDAISSFMRDPDKTTKDMCLAT